MEPRHPFVEWRAKLADHPIGNDWDSRGGRDNSGRGKEPTVRSVRPLRGPKNQHQATYAEDARKFILPCLTEVVEEHAQGQPVEIPASDRHERTINGNPTRLDSPQQLRGLAKVRNRNLFWPAVSLDGGLFGGLSVNVEPDL